jgi:hypothetical protein
MPPRGGLEDPPVESGAVSLDVRAEQPDQDRGDGDGAGLVAGTVLQAAFLAGGALVGPGPPGPRCRGRKDDPPPPGLGQVQVGLAEHDRLRRAQRRVVKDGEERLQVLAPLPKPPGGGQERPGLGGADHDPPVDALGDGWGGPLDPVDRVRAQAAEFDGVAERVVEHRPLAPLGRPGRRLAGQGRGTGAQRQPHGRALFQAGDRKRGAFRPVEGGGVMSRVAGLNAQANSACRWQGGRPGRRR